MTADQITLLVFAGIVFLMFMGSYLSSVSFSLPIIKKIPSIPLWMFRRRLYNFYGVPNEKAEALSAAQLEVIVASRDIYDQNDSTKGLRGKIADATLLELSEKAFRFLVSHKIDDLIAFYARNSASGNHAAWTFTLIQEVLEDAKRSAENARLIVKMGEQQASAHNTEIAAAEKFFSSAAS